MSKSSQKLSLGLLSMGAVLATGVIADSATSPALASTTQPANDLRLAQAVSLCEEGNYPNFYAQVQTSRDPLSVRQSPNGRVIGSIPSGWNVIVLEWSLDGAWARVGSHFSRYSDSYQIGAQTYFGGAPNFSNGWVSAAYLKDQGRLCQKPIGTALLSQPDLFGAVPVAVQSDWLAAGDRLIEQYV